MLPRANVVYLFIKFSLSGICCVNSMERPEGLGGRRVGGTGDIIYIAIQYTWLRINNTVGYSKHWCRGNHTSRCWRNKRALWWFGYVFWDEDLFFRLPCHRFSRSSNFTVFCNWPLLGHFHSRYAFMTWTHKDWRHLHYLCFRWDEIDMYWNGCHVGIYIWINR